MSWGWIIALGAGSYGLKLAGAVAGTRVAIPAVRSAVLLLPPALFAAVIALQTFETDGSLVIDARVAGLVVAIVAAWRRLPFVVVIATAMIATAFVRLAT